MVRRMSGYLFQSMPDVASEVDMSDIWDVAFALFEALALCEVTEKTE